VDNVDITQALHSYNIFMAKNLIETGDPGIMNGKIFMHDCGSKAYRDFISIKPDLRCSGSMSTKTVKMLLDYMKSSTSSSSSSVGGELSASFEGWGFSGEASASFSTSRDNSGSSAIKVLQERTGEVMVSEAHCYMHDVSVNLFSRPRFTPDFIRALYILNSTISDTDSQVAAYTQFIRTFGTHFFRRVDMGASLKYQKVFFSRSKSKGQARERQSCFGTSAEGCAGM